MPYVSITSSKKLSQEEKDTIKTEMGSLIGIVPGKSESVMMIGFLDGTDIFYAGAPKNNAAYISIHLFGACGLAEKKELTEKVFKLMEDKLGVANSDLFVTISEFANWGWQGRLI
jgi:phenylpyruvate tautomerase PptA (4-oxalocrotonate tautomerase family)